VRSHSRQLAAALCALLEEGIVNVKAMDPTQRAGVDSITHVSRATGSSYRSVLIAIARHWMAELRFQ
jgi:hypothetical protein